VQTLTSDMDGREGGTVSPEYRTQYTKRLHSLPSAPPSCLKNLHDI